MLIVNRLRLPIANARAIEDMNANVQKQQADLEYIAIMADIELDDEEAADDAQREL